MPSLEALCCPYWTQDVGRDLTWKRQNKRLCSFFTPNSVEASLTDGNFSIYSAIQALHNLPKKKGIVNPNPPSLADFPPASMEIHLLKTVSNIGDIFSYWM